MYTLIKPAAQSGLSTVVLPPRRVCRDIPPEALMLAEVEHRTANDFAPAIATLQFAHRSIPVGRRVEIDDAIARLGRQAALSRLFLPPLVDEAIDFGAALWKPCEALSAIRST